MKEITAAESPATEKTAKENNGLSPQKALDIIKIAAPVLMIVIGSAFGRDWPYVGWLFYIGVIWLIVALIRRVKNAVKASKGE